MPFFVILRQHAVDDGQMSTWVKGRKRLQIRVIEGALSF